MWVNRYVLIGFFLAFATVLYGGSLRIFNDSPFTLKADILAADGSHRGSISVAPQHQAQWADNTGGNTTWSQTPYTVILTCKNGKQFGVINGVQQGGTVSAMSAQGPLFCEQDKKTQQNEGMSKSPLSPSQTPFDPNQTPNNAQEQGEGASNFFGPADPQSAPTDPIWGPP